MPDDDPRNRFATAREQYDTAGKDGTTSQDSNDGSSGQDSNDGGASNTSKDGKDGQDGTAASEQSGQGIKKSRASVQAYIPHNEKNDLEDTWRRVKALCNLADVDEPPKNDFYAAILRHGYQNFDATVTYLGLSDAFAEYSDIVS